MQLRFTEFIYASAQPLHRVKIAKQKPIEGYVIGDCLAQRKES
jgi:hypothetical protein